MPLNGSIGVASIKGYGLTTLTAVSGLYAFTTATFTPGGNTGRTGPTLAQARDGLSGPETDNWKNNTAFFDTLDGIQLWTVPADGTYRIEAWGAQGGGSGGRGARMRGDFLLIKGEIIRILVGQQGVAVSFGADSDISGGGGSFVVRHPYNSNEAILVIAGGGAGAQSNKYGNPSTLGHGQVTTQAGPMFTTNSPSTTIADNGEGGQNSNQTVMGGAGFFGDAILNSTGVAITETARSFINGGNGGLTTQAFTGGPSANGGFGGGGISGRGADFGPRGGGGGYSGGGSGYNSSSAGGGGSFNSGANQSNSSGVRNGPGQVAITLL